MRYSIFWLLIILLSTGCAKYYPPEQYPEDFRSRVKAQTINDLTVSTVVLSAEEERQVFATNLSKNDIQPVWIEITNSSEYEYTLILPSLDRDYFSPAETAWKSRGFGERGTDEKMLYFLDQHIPITVAPDTIASGFVFTNIDPGVKVLTVELINEHDVKRMEFILPVPGFEADFFRNKPTERYTDDEIDDLDLEGLRTYLESLPCCALGGDRETSGDPLNLVVIGDGPTILAAFVRQGWDLTEPARFATAWRTFWSSVLSSRYRTSPVSALYLFDRPQDAALQKSRKSVDERNHLRLWRAPANYQGQPVWVGQISRDIGVKFSSKTITTHKIDPIVDEARLYVMMDLLSGHAVKSYGMVEGVGEARLGEPRFNYTVDPYFTDGLRVVMVLSSDPVHYIDIDWLEWEAFPPAKSTWARPEPEEPEPLQTSPEREAP